MSKLLNNLHNMSNSEVNNLARNLYCDEEIQLWIAKNANLSARYYLAENPEICEKAKNTLLSGKSFVVKGLLASHGLVRDTELIKEIYNKLSARSGTWRIMQFFVGNFQSKFANKSKFANRWTPPEVLEHIYETRMLDTSYYAKYWCRSMAEHPNCSPRLAIMMSQHQSDKVRQCGFAALVRLEKEEAASA